MSEEDKLNKTASDNKKNVLKLPDTDNMGGKVLKSLSEQNVSSMRKVSAKGVFFSETNRNRSLSCS